MRDFEPDSSAIRWPCANEQDPRGCYRVRCQLGRKCVNDDMRNACAPEGASRPLTYEDGIVRESRREFDWLTWGCFAAAVLGFACSAMWPCWWSLGC